jgi:adenylate kinase family enzyme
VTDRVGDARRILVYGATGSGKSFMARALSELTGIPCRRPGWVPTPKAEQLAHFDALTATDSWILDAAYDAWRHLAYERADLVIAMDYPRLTSLTRVLRRTATRMRRREEICNGNYETWRRSFSKSSLVVWHFRSFGSKRAEMRQWAAAAAGPRVVVLRSPAGARAFLEAQASLR